MGYSQTSKCDFKPWYQGQEEFYGHHSILYQAYV